MAEEHFRLNRLEKVPHRLIRGDVFEIMRGLDSGYDIVILDPPPFAKKKGHLQSASRGYKDLNLLAFRLLNQEDLLFTFPSIWTGIYSRRLFFLQRWIQEEMFSSSVEGGIPGIIPSIYVILKENI
jgi:23S rRNA G2069 N7-methylase RlmK/C1962 C5-methylase RlmI